MRIAWTGPTPADRGTVSYISTQLIDGLAELGFEIDVFCGDSPENLPERLRDRERVRFVCEENRWEWDRWYSRTQLSQVATGAGSRTLVQARLARRMAAEHASRPYDLVYQSSQLELLGLRPLLRRLPPIVFHPHTHAAGELKWLRQELPLADRCTPPARNRAVVAMMATRAALQRRDIQQGRLVIALSERFGEHLAQDYGYPPDRIAVVPNPVDLGRLTPPDHKTGDAQARPLILFVSRISVRKGVESVVSLSRELARTGAAELHVIGGNSKWSDYTPLLDGLDSRAATYRGQLPEEELASLYRRASVLIQPSRFEPFGLTVAEALASGVPVVATSEVGAVAGVDPAVCRVVHPGDDEELTKSVHVLLADLSTRREGAIRRQARSEAERCFAPGLAAERLATALERLSPQARARPARFHRGSARPKTPGPVRGRPPRQTS